MQAPEEFAWTLYAEEMYFHDHFWHDKDATVRLIAARDAEVAAKAWSEGFKAGRGADHNSMWWPPNPYRIEREAGALPIHRTEAGYPRCATCDGGGCADCTDPA